MSKSKPSELPPFALLQPLGLARTGRAVAGFFAAAFRTERAAIEQAAPSFLNPAELAYLGDLQFPRRRESFLLGRFAAKQALGAAVGRADLADLEIIKGVFDQPVPLAPAELSIAHSEGAAVAVACQAGHPIGIDLEFIDPTKADALTSCVTPAEEALVRCVPEPLEVRRYLLWTIKESLSKVLRCGLMTPFKLLEVTALEREASGAWCALLANFPQYKARAWLIEGYALSLLLPKNTETRFDPSPMAEGLKGCRRD